MGSCVLVLVLVLLGVSALNTFTPFLAYRKFNPGCPLTGSHACVPGCECIKHLPTLLDVSKIQPRMSARGILCTGTSTTTNITLPPPPSHPLRRIEKSAQKVRSWDILYWYQGSSLPCRNTPPPPPPYHTQALPTCMHVTVQGVAN